MSDQRHQSEIEEVNVYKGFPWTNPVLQHHIVFIGGLWRGTRIRSIRQYASQFGKVIWIKVFSNKLGSGEGCHCHLILSHPAEYQALFASARQAIVELDLSFITPGRYWVLVNNRFSVLTPKTVRVDLNVDCR